MWESSQDYIFIPYRCKQPDALQHNGRKHSEIETEKHTTLIMRSTGSAFSINYQSTKGKTMQKLLFK